jgi:hypothetical protein
VKKNLSHLVISKLTGEFFVNSLSPHPSISNFNLFYTTREYKEALRQQRSQDNTSIYRSKDSTPTPTSQDGPSLTDSGILTSSFKSQTSTSSPSSSIYSSSKTISSHQNSPMSPHHQNIGKLNNLNGSPNGYTGNNNQVVVPGASPVRTVSPFEEQMQQGIAKRPVQKVIPSRNVVNGNNLINGKSLATNGDNGYIKPSSPIRVSGILTHNSVPGVEKTGSAVQKPLTATVGYVNNSRPGQKLNK